MRWEVSEEHVDWTWTSLLLPGVPWGLGLVCIKLEVGLQPNDICRKIDNWWFDSIYSFHGFYILFQSTTDFVPIFCSKLARTADFLFLLSRSPDPLWCRIRILRQSKASKRRRRSKSPATVSLISCDLRFSDINLQSIFADFEVREEVSEECQHDPDISPLPCPPKCDISCDRVVDLRLHKMKEVTEEQSSSEVVRLCYYNVSS